MVKRMVVSETPFVLESASHSLKDSPEVEVPSFHTSIQCHKVRIGARVPLHARHEPNPCLTLIGTTNNNWVCVLVPLGSPRNK